MTECGKENKDKRNLRSIEEYCESGRSRISNFLKDVEWRGNPSKIAPLNILFFFYQGNSNINQKYLKKAKIDKWQEIMRVKWKKYQVCYGGHYI